MKITAQEEYGLRCLLQLARAEDTSVPTTVREVAEREGISVAYAEKLLHRLKKAGLAESIRGTHGGFRLRGTPRDVTVGDVVRALGSFLNHAAICQRFTGDETRCVHHKNCGVRPVWTTVNYHVQKLLDNMPLSLLLGDESDARHQIVEMASLTARPQTAGGAA